MPVSTKSFTYGRKKKRIGLLKKHLKSASESAIINKQRVAFLRKSSWRNSHAPFLQNRVRNGKMSENFIGKSCSRNA